jgi:hypothetical protein
MLTSQENGVSLLKILSVFVTKKDDYSHSMDVTNNACKAQSMAMANKKDEARSLVVTKKENNRQRRGMRPSMW